MADDLRVRITWQNDEASLRAAMAQAQQILQQVQGNAGNVMGAPTPQQVQAAGGIRARDPSGILNAQGQPVGGGSNVITAPPPTYSTNTTATTGTGTSYNAQAAQAAAPGGGGGAPGGRPSSGLARMSGPLGYAGRMVAIRTIFSAVGAVGEAAQQQQSFSDMNRRVGTGVQQWKDFEDQILKVGVGLGQTRAQMIELTNTFVSSVGKMSGQQRDQAIRGGIELAKTMGIDPGSVVGFLGNAGQKSSNPDYNKLQAVLYTAVQSGMQGREEEVIKAINDLTDIVAKRMPDFGPGGIGGIGEVMRAFSATGIPGLKGLAGAQKAGTLNEFISGGGSDIQNNVLMMYAAREAAAQGLPQDQLSLRKRLEGGLNEPFGQAVLKRFTAGMPEGLGGEAAFSAITGVGGMRNAEALMNGIGNINIGGKLLSPPGYDQTQADKNTQAMVNMSNALQKLGEEVLPALVAADEALTNEIGGLSEILSKTNGLLKVLGTAIGVLGPVLGIGSMVGLPGPMSLASKIPGAAGLASAVGGAAVGGGVAVGAGLATAGLGIGALFSVLFDKFAHSNEPTTLDMFLQNQFGWRLPGAAQRPGGRGKPGQPYVGAGGYPLGHGLTQGYGHTDFDDFHTGIDLDYKEGEGISLPFGTKVIGKTGQGIGYDPLGGNEMLLSGPGNKEILLAHLKDFAAEVGDVLDPGQLIAHSGNTGTSTGPHLHFQTMNPGSGSWASRSIDPLAYLNSILPGSAGGNNEVTVNVNVRQPDNTTDRVRVVLNSSSPYRGVVTSPNWGVSY